MDYVVFQSMMYLLLSFVYPFVNRFDLDSRQMNMGDRFEYNSDSSCHLPKETKKNFPFFSSLLDTLSRSFSRQKKKRKECIEVVLPAAAIFFVINPSVALNVGLNEEKKEGKKSSSCIRQNCYLLSSIINVYETENMCHSCLCLENANYDISFIK